MPQDIPASPNSYQQAIPSKHPREHPRRQKASLMPIGESDQRVSDPLSCYRGTFFNLPSPVVAADRKHRPSTSLETATSLCYNEPS